MSEDLSAPPSKKTKTKSNDDKGEGSEMHYRDFSLRISDGFMRTIGDIVKVVVCSGASIMMLRELKVSEFMNVINELAKGAGLKTKCIPGSTIVKVNADPPLTSDQLEEFRTSLKSRLQDLLPVKANLVVKVLDEKIKNAPEPLLQDSEFAKFVLCWLQEELRKKALKLTPDLEDFMNLRDAAEKMEELSMESESRTKVSILSQNGKGKSFFLNRMLSLTSDSFDEYAVNNKEVYLPQCALDCSQSLKDKEWRKLPEVFKEELENQEQEKNKKETLEKMARNTSHKSSFPQEEMKRLKKAEEDSFEVLKKYCKGGNLRKVQPFLLPEKGPENSCISTTKCVVQLRYSKLYQMKVDYMTMESLQNQLYELVLMMKGSEIAGMKDTKAEREKQSELEERFLILTKHSHNGIIDMELIRNIDKPEAIILKDELTFTGTTKYYIGDGKDVDEDRIFIREKLAEHVTMTCKDESRQELQKMKIAAVKTILVYAPCRFLDGGKELLEMPGSDESDPLARKNIQDVLAEANTVLFMSQSSFIIAEAEVKDILCNSQFLRNLEKNPDDYSLIFMTYPEKDSYMQFNEEDDIENYPFLKTQTQKLKMEVEILDKHLETQLSEAAKKRISSSVVLPVFHSSLLMQEARHTLVELLNKTEEYSHFYEKKSDAVQLLVNQLKRRSFKQVWEDNFTYQHEQIMIETKHSLQETREKFIKEVVSLLGQCAQEAKSQWDENKASVHNLGIFNPYYSGRHPCYKLKLFNMAFGKIEDLDFCNFLADTRKVMENYKDNALKLLDTKVQELVDAHEIDPEMKNEIKACVLKSAQYELNDAIEWYMGKIQMPFAEKKLTEIVNRCFKDCFKTKLLKNAYACTSVEEAKKLVTEKLESTIMAASNYLRTDLERDLHNKRWVSFKRRVVNDKSVPILVRFTAATLNLRVVDEQKKETKQLKDLFQHMIEVVDKAHEGVKKRTLL
ncbi:uncharacterized protein [Lepisosteus oculatus]|uniref:uncharacterized protein isoform X2 n=1 Tax=Lepisosteus oculatus TaxID=7918 RepID=UPI0035F5282C